MRYTPRSCGTDNVNGSLARPAEELKVQLRQNAHAVADGAISNEPRRVIVLMSTYQGEEFVRQQLESILVQLPAAGQIIIRDDGSSDRTVDEVSALIDSRITLIRGSNLGFGPSFLTLLSLAPQDADMVMFSDQDDVWLPGKIERAWQYLCKLENRCGLYGSAQMLADKELRPLGTTSPSPRPPSMVNALTENIITGCTAAINRPALELLQRAGVPLGVHFHDWWLYLVVSAFGTVTFDEQPTLLYRQHGKNVIGRGPGWLIRFHMRNDWVGIMMGQLHAFLEHYGDLLPEHKRNWILRYFCTVGRRTTPRWRLVFSWRRWQHAIALDLGLRVMLALHKLRLWPPAHRRL